MDISHTQDPQVLQVIQPQPTNPIVQLSTPCIDFVVKHFTIFSIFFFELIAMVFFTYCVITFGGITTFPGIWIVWSGMGISLAISGIFGWGHINPAVTLAFMIKKQNKTSITHGVLLILSQFIGAFIGTFIAWSFHSNLIAPFPIVHPLGQTLSTFVQQIFASWMFVLCILILVSSDLRPTDNDLQIYISIPLCLVAVCLLFSLTLGTNPAQALAFQVCYYIYHNTSSSDEQLSSIWSVVIGTTLGGILAGLSFEFIYRRYALILKKELNQLAVQLALKVQLLPKYEQISPIIPQLTVPQRKTQIQIL